MGEYLTPYQVDELLKLPRGRAARLAREGRLPACILPDGTVRFDTRGLDAFLKQKHAQAARSPQFPRQRREARQPRLPHPPAGWPAVPAAGQADSRQEGEL